jgi:hypothetical protein
MRRSWVSSSDQSGFLSAPVHQLAHAAHDMPSDDYCTLLGYGRLSAMADIIYPPTINCQHLCSDEACVWISKESHGSGDVLGCANPADHGSLAH